MDVFEYPIDSSTLLRKKRHIRRKLLEMHSNLLNKKIAILGGSTTNEVADQIGLFLLNYGIHAEFYQSGYAQYWQEAMFGTAELDEFHPDIIYIHTTWRNIEKFPTTADSLEKIEDILTAEYTRFEQMWEVLAVKFSCPIIQNNFERPNYRLMGNRDIWDPHGRSNFISRLNQMFYDYAIKHEKFYINDIDYLSADYGLNAWEDVFSWHMYKYAMSLNAIPVLASSLANIIKSLYGYNKKVLVLDLDNTLWGGIIGDEGVDNIVIGPELPEGQVYAEFQNYCKNLKQIGVVLAVDSKNDEINALEGINHPGGILRPTDFVSIKANWENKDQNLKSIADELDLNVESFVFVDDNPAERAIVANQIPNVAVPSVEGVENYVKILDHSGYFETTILSEEDLEKTEMYHSKEKAVQSIAAYADYGEYLDSLEMVLTVQNFESVYIQRIAQLTNKTNQFNLTTLRCNEEEIRYMAEQPNYLCLCGKLKDKFGDNGVVTVVVGERKGTILHLRLWLMSCRVFKRSVENAMMDCLVEEAAMCGITNITGYYYPTEKNAMVENFYRDMGFQQKRKDISGKTIWDLQLCEYEKCCNYMVIENKL